MAVIRSAELNCLIDYDIFYSVMSLLVMLVLNLNGFIILSLINADLYSICAIAIAVWVGRKLSKLGCSTSTFFVGVIGFSFLIGMLWMASSLNDFYAFKAKTAMRWNVSFLSSIFCFDSLCALMKGALLFSELRFSLKNGRSELSLSSPTVTLVCLSLRSYFSSCCISLSEQSSNVSCCLSVWAP